MNKIFKIVMIVVAIIAISTSTANAFSIGSIGDDVAQLQITLLEAGYDIPLISSGQASFGYFGSQTKAALAKYEAVNAPALRLGAVVSPDIYDHVTFNQSFTKGGQVVATTSTASAYTLTNKELRKEVSYIQWYVDNTLTLTTMASTSAPFSNLKVGEIIEVYFYNSGDTTVTFAAGTGVDLQETEGGTVLAATLELARLTFLKKVNGDIAFFFEGGQLGD